MSPWTVADVAARRARRAALQALFHVRGPTRLESVCKAYGATTIHELPVAALDAPSEAWCSVSRRADTVAALRRLDGACARAMARADRAAALRFDVFGQELSFAAQGRVDWSSDPVSGHRYPAVAAESLPLIQEGADPKYPWVLGRLDHLIALGQGYWVADTTERRASFAQRFVDCTRDFLRENPVGVGVQWACAMEVSLRAANLAQALRMFADAAEAREPAFVAEVLLSIADHCAWVESHLEDTGRVPNNHLVANHVGLLVASLLFPELPGAVERIAASVRGLRAQVQAQVHPDGWSFEGSVPYHRLAAELFSLGYLVAEQCGVDLGEAFRARLWGMFRVALSYCSGEGLAPQLGDNDSGRVFPLRDRADLDHGYLAPFGAALFDDAELKATDLLCDEAVWLLGGKAARGFERLPREGIPRSLRSDDAGLHVLRAKDAVVSFSAGPNGQKGIGGHSHNDKLSFELHVRGVPLIVDPGTGTYTRSAAVRNAFRSTGAHGTIQVDDRELSPLSRERLFLLEDRARAEVVSFEAGGQRPSLVARHEAFSGVRVERRIELCPEDGALLVRDLLDGQGVHTVVSRIPLSSAKARCRRVTGAELARVAKVSGESVGDEVVEVGPEGAPLAVLLFGEGLRPTVEPAPYSPGYGRVESGWCVTAALRPRLPRALWFCVLWTV